MKTWFVVTALCACVPVLAAGQQSDTLHAHGDTLAHHAITLEAITVTAAPVRREDPTTTVRITPSAIQQTPAIDAYDLLRQIGGVEVHEQGQGPGFASDAS